jgi:hypothetical protein
MGYPVFIEVSRKPVAQAEHTVHSHRKRRINPNLVVQSMFFIFNFSVNRRYQHFIVAFLARLNFLENVIATLELTNTFKTTLFTLDSRGYRRSSNPSSASIFFASAKAHK